GRLQLLRIDNDYVDDHENGDVEDAGTLALAPDTPGGRLQPSAHAQHRAGRQVGLELDDEVEIWRLPGRAAHRLGLVDRRHLDDAIERLHRLAKEAQTIAFVRPHPEKRPHASPLPPGWILGT